MRGLFGWGEKRESEAPFESSFVSSSSSVSDDDSWWGFYRVCLYFFSCNILKFLVIPSTQNGWFMVLSFSSKCLKNKEERRGPEKRTSKEDDREIFVLYPQPQTTKLSIFISAWEGNNDDDDDFMIICAHSFVAVLTTGASVCVSRCPRVFSHTHTQQKDEGPWII